MLSVDPTCIGLVACTTYTYLPKVLITLIDFLELWLKP